MFLNSFWFKKEWDFFLYPIIDDNHHTLYYLAFDDLKQLNFFTKLIKISGVWVKTACYISTYYPIDDVKKAIDNNDINFFIAVPTIWQKTAKKIILELKDKINLSDLDEIDTQKKEKEKIVNAIVSLWYSKNKVKEILKSYTWDLSDYRRVIKEIISML